MVSFLWFTFGVLVGILLIHPVAHGRGVRAGLFFGAKAGRRAGYALGYHDRSLGRYNGYTLDLAEKSPLAVEQDASLSKS